MGGGCLFCHCRDHTLIRTPTRSWSPGDTLGRQVTERKSVPGLGFEDGGGGDSARGAEAERAWESLGRACYGGAGAFALGGAVGLPFSSRAIPWDPICSGPWKSGRCKSSMGLVGPANVVGPSSSLGCVMVVSWGSSLPGRQFVAIDTKHIVLVR